MKKFSLVFVALLSGLQLLSQNGWNWPTDEKLYNKALEKQAYYKVQMGQGKHADALETLQWLYDNNANLNPSIYIDGVKCAEEAMAATEDKEIISKMKEKSLWMYDQRVTHFGNEASVLDRKAYTAFKYYYKTKAKYSVIHELYEQAYEKNGAGISDFNLIPYMTAAKYGYEWKVDGITGEKVLSIHSTITEIIDQKEKTGQNMKDYRDKVDALFSSISGLLSCSFIEDNLVPRLIENPDDIGTAKKIVAYSITAKCTNEAYFLEAGETVLNSEPSFSFYKIIADKRLARNEMSKAQELYEKALPLAQSSEEKYDVLMAQAKLASKQGKKSQARSLAIKASNEKPGEKEPFNLIGNLYYGSFNDCAGYKSKVQDRLVFIAAYEMYQKAGNTSQMKACEEQFPSAEEIFSENLKEGEQMSTGCWIDKTVTISKRST